MDFIASIYAPHKLQAITNYISCLPAQANFVENQQKIKPNHQPYIDKNIEIQI